MKRLLCGPWTLPLVLSVLGLVLAPQSALAAISYVDDFQQGPFDHSTAVGPQIYNVPIPDSGGHAMTSSRTVTLNPAGGWPASCRTEPVPAPGGQGIRVLAGGSGTVQVGWDWGSSRDLSVLGTVDRITVHFLSNPLGGEVTAFLGDGVTTEAVVKPTAGDEEIMAFFLDDWSVVDATSARSLTFEFSGSSDAAYVIWEIRFGRSGSLNVDFVGDFVATQIPPVPSSPLRYRAYDSVSNPLYQVDMVIQSAVGGGPVEVLANWSEPSAVTSSNVTEFRWDENGVFTDCTFLLSFDVDPIPGGPIPELYPPDDIHGPESFILRFPILLRDAMGAVVGDSETRLLFQVDPSQGAEFPSLIVTPHASRAWTSGFDVSFDLLATSGVEVYEPLFHATWTSDWVESTITGAAITSGPRGAGALRAHPSVTRGATVIHAAHPFGMTARIAVHDVTGRLLRHLSAPAGQSRVAWDGADAAGRSLPAGVYFLQLNDRERSGVTRVTRIR